MTEDFEDIKDQDTDNYEYDAIGNLVRDEQEEIDRIEWTVYGKVKAVHRKAGSEKPYLEFGYDAGGNRISKLSRDKDGHEKVTLYVRDASGNVMAIYEKTPERGLAVTEHHVYGSSRLGIVRTNSASDLATLHSGRVLGLKDFELSDHLGNVRVVLKDVRNSVGLTEVSGAYDYYAFGKVSRSLTASGRHTFNGKEYDRELGWQDYGMRMYNPDLGRFPSVDPISREFPMLSPFQFASNMPIKAIDLDGLEAVWNIEDAFGYIKQVVLNELESIGNSIDNFFSGGTVETTNIPLASTTSGSTTVTTGIEEKVTTETKTNIGAYFRDMKYSDRVKYSNELPSATNTTVDVKTSSYTEQEYKSGDTKSVLKVTKNAVSPP